MNELRAYAPVLACVVAIAIGQILFKTVANAWETTRSFFHPSVLGVLFVALTLYGAATLGWIWALRGLPLTRAYPFMALSFVLVPVAGRLLFGEPINTPYLVGTAFLVVGILIITLGGASS